MYRYVVSPHCAYLERAAGYIEDAEMTKISMMYAGIRFKYIPEVQGRTQTLKSACRR